MENFFRRSGIDVPEPVRRFLQGETEDWLRIEEFRDGNTLVVRTDLPGIDPDTDIDINVSEDILQITAGRAEPASRDQPGYRRNPEHPPRKSISTAVAICQRMHP